MSKARVEHGPLFKLLLGVYQDGKLIIRIGQGAMRDAKWCSRVAETFLTPSALYLNGDLTHGIPALNVLSKSNSEPSEPLDLRLNSNARIRQESRSQLDVHSVQLFLGTLSPKGPWKSESIWKHLINRRCKCFAATWIFRESCASCESILPSLWYSGRQLAAFLGGPPWGHIPYSSLAATQSTHFFLGHTLNRTGLPDHVLPVISLDCWYDDRNAEYSWKIRIPFLYVILVLLKRTYLILLTKFRWTYLSISQFRGTTTF